jgi:transcriptional regulator with XRE-family HTH domain/tetratricopeptide (TPR) repeat protein
MFGEALKAYRRQSGMTQEDLAAQAGVSVRSISNLECGRIGAPRPHTVQLLAEALGLAGADLDEFCRAAIDNDTPVEAFRMAATDPPPPETRLGSVARPVPAQLPPDIPGFAGRHEQLAELDAALEAGLNTEAGPVLTLSGSAGVGKTALATRWARRVAHRFADGQLYLNLRGFDPGGRLIDPPEAIQIFLDALGVHADEMPTELDARAALYRSLLADRRVLVVLDNARDADHVRPLLPGTATAIVVITSRDQLTGLVTTAGARPLALDLLPTAEAYDLLVGRLGADRVKAEPDAAAEIIHACARLPLALAIATARAQQNRFSLATLAEDLTDQHDRLDALDTGEITGGVRAAFSWSYTALDPAVQQTFRLLSLHAGPDISLPAAANLIGQPVPRTRRLLRDLARANLLTEHVPGRYTYHDMLRLYAMELAASTDSPDMRQAASTRLLDYYTHALHDAHRLLYSSCEPIEIPPPSHRTQTTPQHFTDERAAFRWIDTEKHVLLAAVHQARASGQHKHCWQIVRLLEPFTFLHGNWHARLVAWRAALDAAQNLPPAAQIAAHRFLAHGETHIRRYSAAHRHLQQALDLAIRVDDVNGQANVHFGLGYLWRHVGDLDRGMQEMQQALHLYQASGGQFGQRNAMSHIGLFHALRGNHAEALSISHQALKMHQKASDSGSQAFTWRIIGYAHDQLGDHSQAVTCYRRSLRHSRSMGNPIDESTVNLLLCKAYRREGDHTAADQAKAAAQHTISRLNIPLSGLPEFDSLTELHHRGADVR